MQNTRREVKFRTGTTISANGGLRPQGTHRSTTERLHLPLWKRFIGRRYGNVQVLSYHDAKQFKAECLICHAQFPISYDRLFKIAHRHGALQCSHCLELVGRATGGVFVMSKLEGNRYLVRCGKQHEFQCRALALRRSVRCKGLIVCRACQHEAKLNRPRPRPHRTHGLSKTSPAWKRWMGMKSRCNRHPDYRLVTICDRWRDFANFYADMGEPPVNTVLDRIDNAKGYSPENCRWASWQLSTENRKNTIWVTLNGAKMRVADAAKKLGVEPSVIYRRVDAGKL